MDKVKNNLLEESECYSNGSGIHNGHRYFIITQWSSTGC